MGSPQEYVDQADVHRDRPKKRIRAQPGGQDVQGRCQSRGPLPCSTLQPPDEWHVGSQSSPRNRLPCTPGTMSLRPMFPETHRTVLLHLWGSACLTQYLPAADEDDGPGGPGHHNPGWGPDSVGPAALVRFLFWRRHSRHGCRKYRSSSGTRPYETWVPCCSGDPEWPRRYCVGRQAVEEEREEKWTLMLGGKGAPACLLE